LPLWPETQNGGKAPQGKVKGKEYKQEGGKEDKQDIRAGYKQQEEKVFH
jgi:hypothetical protein